MADIEKLLNDPDFMSLPEEEQNAFIDEMRQKDFGAIPKTENVLQRAVNTFSPQQIGYQAASGQLPMLGASVGSAMTGGPKEVGLSAAGQGEGIRQRGLEGIKNPFGRFALDVATDPMTYVGGGEAIGGIGKGLKKVFPYTNKEARVGFTRGVEKSLVKRRNALTRGYSRKLEGSKATVDLSDIVEPGSDFTHFTMKEAQDIKNAITTGIPDAVKKGVKINPKHFASRETAGMISDAMKKADPEFADTMRKFGEHSENFKEAISPIASAGGSEKVFGKNLMMQMFGHGGLTDKEAVALQQFAPKVAKRVRGAKKNENAFRWLRVGAIGGAAQKFIPDIFKRAVLSKVSE